VEEFLYAANNEKLSVGLQHSMHEGLTDNEIISMVKSNNNESKEDPNEEPLEIISKKGVLEYLDELIVFFEHSSDVPIDSNELIMLQKLRRQVLKSYVK